jgi:hypothetical protein
MGPRKELSDVLAPFSAADSLKVYRLQRRGVSLDLQQGLTQPRRPLWEAWLAFLTQQAMGQPTHVLYDPHEGEAFMQVSYRAHQAAADVVFVAPALDESRRAAKAWFRLLEGACVEAATRGIQRVFANLPESGAEVDVFHQAGFSLYGSEDVYVLAGATSEQRMADGIGLRPQRPEDWPALQRLCVAVTPQRVRQAEGGIAVAIDRGGSYQRYVLPAKDGDDLLAALTLSVGTLAHWLRVIAHPDAQAATIDSLVKSGLSILDPHPPKTVYCNVRKYEGGVRGALEGAGFELYDTRALVVKHTVAWIKASAQDLVPALKGSAEPVPPIYHVNGEPEFQPSNGRLAAKHEA